jgi:hypothetical protein
MTKIKKNNLKKQKKKMRQLGLGRKPCNHGICEILEPSSIKKLNSQPI